MFPDYLASAYKNGARGHYLYGATVYFHSGCCLIKTQVKFFSPLKWPVRTFFVISDYSSDRLFLPDDIVLQYPGRIAADNCRRLGKNPAQYTAGGHHAIISNTAALEQCGAAAQPDMIPDHDAPGSIAQRTIGVNNIMIIAIHDQIIP